MSKIDDGVGLGIGTHCTTIAFIPLGSPVKPFCVFLSFDTHDPVEKATLSSFSLVSNHYLKQLIIFGFDPSGESHLLRRRRRGFWQRKKSWHYFIQEFLLSIRSIHKWAGKMSLRSSGRTHWVPDGEELDIMSTIRSVSRQWDERGKAENTSISRT